MTNTRAADQSENGRAFEWWMVCILANGAGYYAFVILLIPAYVTEVTGNAADAGVVMAIIGLAAVTGPVLGRFADRYLAHRLVLNLGMLAMAVGHQRTPDGRFGVTNVTDCDLSQNLGHGRSTRPKPSCTTSLRGAYWSCLG